jgi:uncharacterized protein
MKPIKVDTIPVNGLFVDFLLDPVWLKEIAQDRPLGFVPSGPVEVHGELTRTGQGILFRGRIKGIIRLQCSRCLESFLKAVEESVGLEWRLISPLPNSSGREEAGVQIEDLETGLIQDGVLDLAESILEEVILTVPIQPLCRESCLGLCPVCGENKNMNLCNCKSKGGNSPFSVLKNLKD